MRLDIILKSWGLLTCVVVLLVLYISSNIPSGDVRDPHIVKSKTNIIVKTKPSENTGLSSRFSQNIPIDDPKIPRSDQRIKSFSNPSIPEAHRLVFLKVHKTGSSTVQNIFLRFGLSRNLTFVLAHDKHSLTESGYSNVISFQNSLSEKNIVPHPTGKQYDIMCCHVIYNKRNFTRMLPADMKYIGITRQPIKRLESAFRFFKLFPGVNLTDFAASPFRYDKEKNSMANNRMAFEFGFPLRLFPNSGIQLDGLVIKQEVNDYLDELMNDYCLIMINERLDESAVLLKRILGWQLKDIFYQKQMVSKEEPRRFSSNDVDKLNAFLYLDFALYERAVEEFNKKVLREGEDFVEEVAHFRKINERVTNYCKSESMSTMSFEASPWSSSFVISKHDCYLYARKETPFIQDIRKMMYGHLNN
ncbi:galactosylceramide sulfotransferase-like [Mya arenaria]|uniref:galactosylceramide sulfotransferase-like n=1 Tax=Mya arenaria TaxID=6604 RepID=UPI0022E51261|nr:galactosylceramide sulfotransferase-like [Mya arenaria]